MRGFIIGIVFSILILVVGGYLFVRGGGVSLATTAHPLPLEEKIADMALQASMGNAAEQKNPLPFNDDNMVAAVQCTKSTARCVTVLRNTGAQRFRKGCFPRRLSSWKRRDDDRRSGRRNLLEGDPWHSTFRHAWF